MKNRRNTEAGKAYKEENKKAEKLLKKYRGENRRKKRETHFRVWSYYILYRCQVALFTSKEMYGKAQENDRKVNLSFLKTSSEKSELVFGRLYESILNS
jgi:hypothetical protein